MYKLILCEKPSTARAISAVLNVPISEPRKNGFFIGNDFIITWCAGHLLELAALESYGVQYAKWQYSALPIIPQTWKYTPVKGKEKLLKLVTELMNRADVDCVINACDAGREGENIFRLVYKHANCTKKVKRLWISSLTDEAIKTGFANLKDGAEYDNLYAAATCRERADWAVGINATRLFSVLYGATLNTGRVQSPTLAMLFKRENSIENFVQEPFYTPTIDCGRFTAFEERIKDKSQADKIIADCKNKAAVVRSVNHEQKIINPPKLYDLTTLQREANRIYGFTAQQTLDYVQSLYEKKIVSYPRTNAKYITSDMRDSILKIIGNLDFTPDIDRIIGVVSDHHALTPTIESITADISALPSGESNVFKLILSRLIAAVSPKHVYEAVTVTLDCGGNIFTAKGKTVITQGWKSQSNETAGDIPALPELLKGQTFDSVTVSVKEGFTSPLKHFTEDTLLAAIERADTDDIPDNIERCGLGTPATRAAILEKLIKSGFVERQNRNMIPTDKGKNLITVLPYSLTSPILTAEWEHKLNQVEHGELTERDFMEGITAFVKSIISENSVPKPEFMNLFGAKTNDNPILGKCPRCGDSVRESNKGFFCDSKSCGFKLWKASKFWTAKKKPLTAEIVTALLKNKRVALKGLYSEKTGKTYSAVVVIDDNNPRGGERGDFVNYRLEF